MDGSENLIAARAIQVDGFHDVDFADSRPDAWISAAQVIAVLGQHPERRPQALPGRHLDAGFYAAVLEGETVTRVDPRGGPAESIVRERHRLQLQLLDAPVAEGLDVGLEGRAELSELSDGRYDGTVGFWYKKRDAGFSNARLDSGREIEDYGVEGRVRVSDKLDISARATVIESEADTTLVATPAHTRESAASVQADYRYSERVTLSAELRYVEMKDFITPSLSTKELLGAVKADVAVRPGFNIYGIVQGTLDREGTTPRNNLYTLGTRYRVSKKLNVTAEYSDGDRGNAAQVGLDYNLSDTHTLYGTYTLSTDRTTGTRGVATVGQRKQMSDQLSVFTEHQYTHEDRQNGVGQTYGLDYKYDEYTAVNLSLQSANLNTFAGGLTDRDAISASITYLKEKVSAYSKLEYRRDKGDTVNQEQWLTTNRVSYRANPAWAFQGKLNYSETKDRDGGFEDAKFVEFGVGFAYRPIENDRLNILGRYSYLYDLYPLSQSAEPDQKAHILSLEAIYDLSRKWELGGKLAYRESSIRTDRVTGAWVDNDATLAAVRLRYHIVKNWDGMVEYHWLDSDASATTKSGGLLALYRHIGDNLKVGVGYNFTDFDDDLGNTDFDSKGWFINLIGKY